MEIQKNMKKVARKGYITELATLCNCSRHTVRKALFEEQKGEKSNLVRKMFEANYKILEL